MLSVTPIFTNELPQTKPAGSVAGTVMMIDEHNVRNALWCLDLGETKGVKHIIVASDGNCSVDTISLGQGVFLVRVWHDEPIVTCT